MAYPPADAADRTTGDVIAAAHINALDAAVQDIVTELGSAPKGGAADLTARLTALDSVVALKALADASNITPATWRSALSLVIGTNVQAWDADLDTLAAGGVGATALLDALLSGTYVGLAAGGASIENIGAIESNVNTVAASGATETLDTSLFGVHDITMDQACTFTFSNPAPSGKNTTFVLILRGAFSPTWPAAVRWSGGVAPTYTTPAIYVFTTINEGTTWNGAQVGKAFA